MAEEIGSAYLTIKPKMSDNFSSEVEQGGKGAGGRFGDAFSVAAGNLISGAIQNLGSAAADVFKNAFDNYANYEQLVGGIDTLFKESSDVVQRNAAEAFRTTGLSANEYMENVTSFSASLLAGLGGDTAKAAEYADMAMRDMSDNANKMGTDMGAITTAYQGFAKQNYTMLDNLKLGYGGTKTEMERLLKDASKIAGVEFNIDNYSDVIQAIHVMQEEMGIAGTTAKEAEGTISGSIAMLSASWQNFLTGIFDENADMGALGENLFSSLGAVIKNVAPRIMLLVQRVIFELPGAIITALQAIPEMLAPTILQIFGEQLGGQINSALGGAVSTLVDTFTQLGASFMELFGSIVEFLTPVIETIVQIVAAAMPIISDAIGFVIDFVTNSVLPTIQQVLEIFQPVIEQITAAIQEKMPLIQEIIQNVMDAIKSIIETVWPVVSEIVITAANAIKDIIDTVWPFISDIIDTVTNGIRDISEAVWPKVSGAVETAADAIKSAIDGIKSIVDTVSRIFEDVRNAIEGPIRKAKEFIDGIISDIENAFSWMNIQVPAPELPQVDYNWDTIYYGDGSYTQYPNFYVSGWYGTGGFVDNATLIGVGERGGEMIWPSYEPYFDKYAQGIAEHMPAAGVDIHDCTFNVRKESDIRAVAVELNTLINRQTAGGIA